MKKTATLSLLAAMAVAGVQAHAATVSAGGVTWDTVPSTGGLSASFNFQQWFTADPTDFIVDDNGTAADPTDDYIRIVDDSAVAPGAGGLVGLGEIAGLSDGRGPGPVGSPDFCNAAGGCELTFAFGGLIPTPPSGGKIVFDTSAAWLNVYIDTDPAFNTAPVGSFNLPGDFNDGTAVSSSSHADFADAQNGTLWAAFTFDSFFLDGTILGGKVEATLSVRSGVGLADVVAALDFNETAPDMEMTGTAIFEDNNLYSTEGNGQLATVKVSEPGTLAIFGLGLLGLAAAGKRRKA